MPRAEAASELERTDMGYWFPLLQNAGVRIPATILVHTDVDLLTLIDGEAPDGFSAFLAELRTAAESIGYPCFLRNGFTSHKHNWTETCYLTRDSNLAQHVFNIVEFCAMVDIALEFPTWAVREMIPTAPLFYAFKGMPIVEEWRAFIRDGVIEHLQPYWPVEAIENSFVPPSREDWRPILEATYALGDTDRREIERIASMVGHVLPGYWSMDVLRDTHGRLWLTDMAEGERSFRWDPNGDKRGNQ